MDKPQIDTNNEELRKKLLDVNLIREHKYTPNNVVLVTLDDVIEIFHELIPYTMTKLDELESRDQQIALAAQIDGMEKAKNRVLRRTEIPKDAKNPTRDIVVVVGEECARIIDKDIATLKAQEKS